MSHATTASPARPLFRPAGQLATRNRYVPNVPVSNHLGESFLFYDELVKGRVVIVNLMSIRHDSHYPVIRNLAQVQRLLGRRLGREVWIHSISVDPHHDTVDRLRIFSRRYGARHGWQFFTGEPSAISTIRNSLFIHNSAVAAAAAPAPLATVGAVAAEDEHEDEHEHLPDCSMGLLRYGNDAIGLWGSVPAKTDPQMIVERLSWIMPKQPGGAAQRLTRRGPFPTTAFRAT